MQPTLARPRHNLTEAVVRSAITNPSPLVRHGLDLLDPTTLRVTGDTLPVDWDTGANVDYAYRPSDPGAGATEVTETRLKASLPLVGLVAEGLILGRLHRLWTEMLATDGTPVRFWWGTFMAALPGLDDDGTMVRSTVDLLPREHLFSTRAIEEPRVIAAAAAVLPIIRADLSSVFGITSTRFPSPSGASTLGLEMIIEAGTSYAEMWRRMLHGIAYDQVTTAVDGTPTAQPLSVIAGRGPEETYGPGASGRVIVPGTVGSLDPELPNRITYIVRGPTLGPTLGNGITVRTNQSTGPASLARRGFPVPRVVTAEAANQAELEAFADADSARLFAGGGERWTGRVGLNPLHGDRDRVSLTRPRLGMDAVLANVVGWHARLRRVNSPDAALMDIECETVVT